jgi:tetratricopeptide (TPR) repeat protein
MKHLVTAFAIVLLTTAARTLTTTATPDPPLSPAQHSMAVAQKLLDKNPKDFEAFNALALALSRRARETSDVTYYTQAEEALQKSFSISPDNFDGRRIQVWLLLGKHEFAAARDESQKLIKKMADDVMIYGFLTDANVELGNYKEAEAAAQWMLDLRPGNVPGITRAAYLRELFGDTEGSLELMRMALDSTPPNQTEDAAWIITQMAHLNLEAGKIDEAEKLCQKALGLFPDYHYALANLAKVRIQQKRYDDAVVLSQRRYQAAAHAENLFDLAESLQLAGKTAEAKNAFAEFERKSLLETNRDDNSNHELIFYYADYAHQPAKALEVAQREIARRHDVFTIDSYAWALHVNGREEEARKQIESALAVGIRSAKLFRHAGEIALQRSDLAAARHYLQLSVELNSIGSEQARLTLLDLNQNSAKR